MYYLRSHYHTGSMIRVVCPFVFAVLLLNPLDMFSQDSVSGFYVILQVRKNCPNIVSTIDGSKSYCLPTEPVIAESDFESISEIEYDSLLQLKYITLKLTLNGFKSLKFLAERLPDSKLVLVIEDRVAGIFDSVDKRMGRYIPIRAGINSPGIEWIHERLKKKAP
jgi:hypothetical protein